MAFAMPGLLRRLSSRLGFGPALRHVGFLVIGVEKGGTSTLAQHLRRHPSIGLGRKKELHFFDDEARDWRVPAADAYHAHFRFPVSALIHGECTPAYVFWEPAYDRIRAYNPAMRLILLVRDPIERAFSQWEMEFARGNERQPFERAIREGRRRVPADRWNGPRRAFSYVERGFYGRQLAALLERFPREQILILASEQLFADTDGALAAVTDFLGVPRFRGPAPALHARKAPDVAYPSRLTRTDAAYLADLFADDVALFARLSGHDTSRWLAVDRYPD